MFRTCSIAALLLLLLCSAASNESRKSDEEDQKCADFCLQRMADYDPQMCKPIELNLQAEIEKIFAPTAQQVEQLKILLERAFSNEPEPDGSSEESTSTEPKPIEAACPADHECVLQWQCRSKTSSNRKLVEFDYKSTNQCAHLKTCCHKTNKIEFPPDEYENIVPCGMRHKEGVDTQLDRKSDREATFGEFPWTVAIFYKTTTMLKYIGVGSILAPNVVLSAAEITVAKDNLLVRAGEWNMKSTDELIPYQERDVSRTFVYRTDNSLNNVALLFLHMELSIAPHISPICLPASPSDRFDRSKCIVTSWGRGSQERQVLKHIPVSIADTNKCKGSHSRLEFSNGDNYICAGTNKGLCKSDIGAPLLCPIRGSPDRFYQIGMVILDANCKLENLHTIYSNLSTLTSWVRNTLKELSVDNNYYTL